MMYRCVTVWHRKPGGGYEKTVFKKAFVNKSKKAEINAGEYEKCDRFMLRIFTPRKCSFDVGDRLSIGTVKSEIPTRDSYVISAIFNNMNACNNLRHYKIECV